MSDSSVPSESANSIQVIKMCEAFSDLGLELFLTVAGKKANEVVDLDEMRRFYGVKGNFSIVSVPFFRLKFLESFFILRMLRGLVFGFLSLRLARQKKPDLVYGRSFIACFFSVLIGIPTMYEAHTPSNIQSSYKKFFFKLFVRNSNFKRLVVITHALKQYFESNVNELVGKVVVAHDAADLASFSVNPRRIERKKNSCQVGYAGSLYPGKGMEVIGELPSKIPWATFHVIGGTGSDLENWKRRCADSNNIIFYGHHEPAKIPEFLQAMDILLLPNQKRVSVYGGDGDISSWTSPLKAFEYMAARKPVIVSRIPVLKEIFEHRVNALLCEPDNINEWVSAIEELISNNDLASDLSDMAFSHLVENHSWDRRAKDVLAGFVF